MLSRGSTLAFDQMLSSMSNLLMGLLAIRSLGLDDFGAFSTVYVAYILVLGLIRAAVVDPYMAGIYAHDEPHDRLQLVLIFGLGGFVFGLVAAGSILALDMSSVTVALLLVPTITGVFVLDAVRYIGFKVPAMAGPCVADGIWVAIALVALLTVGDELTVGEVLLLWAGAGTVGLLVAIPFVPRIEFGHVRFDALTTHRKLRTAYALDYSLSSGVGQLGALLLGVLFGFAALGSFRAVSLVMRPATTVVTAVQSVLLNEFDMRTQRPGANVLRFAQLVALALLAISVLWSAFILLLPESWLVDLMGPDWLRAKNLVLPVAVLNFGLVAIVPAQLLLRFRRASRSLLQARVFGSIALIGGLLVGDYIAAVRAAVWGMALGALLGAAVFWIAVYRTPSER